MILVLTVLFACTSSPPPDTAPPSEGEGTITLSAQRVPKDDVLHVTYERPGPNGCYRQTDVQTTLADHRIVHAYTTSQQGEMCTQALVPGGFEATVALTVAGTWRGEIVVDGRQTGAYTVEVE